MCSPQFISQSSWDLGIYLPSELDSEANLYYQSAEMLIHSINFDVTSSAHRMELDLFDPTSDDVEASSALIDDAIPSPNKTHFDKNDLTNYFYEQSTVVPHIPNLSNESIMNDDCSLSPSSSDMSSPNPHNIKKFLVFDETTRRERRPLLHEFIRIVLEKDEYSHIAEYIDRKKGIFKLHQPKEVAELWKQVKGRNSDNGKLNFKTKNFIDQNFSSIRNDL